MVHYITVNTRPRVYVLRFRVWVVKSCVQESALHKSTSLQVAILEGHGEAWCFSCFGIWDFVRVGLGFRVSVLGFRFLGFLKGSIWLRSGAWRPVDGFRDLSLVA